MTSQHSLQLETLYTQMKKSNSSSISTNVILKTSIATRDRAVFDTLMILEVDKVASKVVC